MTWKPPTETNFVLDDAAEDFAALIEREERHFGVCDSHIGTKVPHEPSENCLNWRPVDWPKPPALAEPEDQ